MRACSAGRCDAALTTAAARHKGRVMSARCRRVWPAANPYDEVLSLSMSTTMLRPAGG